MERPVSTVTAQARRYDPSSSDVDRDEILALSGEVEDRLQLDAALDQSRYIVGIVADSRLACSEDEPASVDRHGQAVPSGGPCQLLRHPLGASVATEHEVARAFDALVLEGVPSEVASLVTAAVDIPVIGIGAGDDCDGQVLVYHDVLGIEDRMLPKFVRRYADLKTAAVDGVRAYAEDVRAHRFPSADESYHLSAQVAETLGLYGRPA